MPGVGKDLEPARGQGPLQPACRGERTDGVVGAVQEQAAAGDAWQQRPQVGVTQPLEPALQRGLEWLRDTDLRPLLPGIASRSLLLHGANDAVSPLAAARWLQRTLPACRLEVFPDAGHAPFLTDPARCGDLLSQFCHATRAH